MNRRTFFTRLVAGVVGVTVATHVPVQWMPVPLQKQTAIEYLRAYYNTLVKGKGAAAPTHIYVGRELYDAYRDELEQNVQMVFYAPRTQEVYFKGIRIPFDEIRPNLMFKGCKLCSSGKAGWDVQHALWATSARNMWAISYNTETFWRHRA